MRLDRHGRVRKRAEGILKMVAQDCILCSGQVENLSHQAAQDSGSYLLIIRLAGAVRIRIGAKGIFHFPAGWYVYAGSAKRGLRARIERHLRKKKRMRWHIDYLLRRATVRQVILFTDPRRWHGISSRAVGRLKTCPTVTTECELAALLLKLGGSIVVPRFGSSDCLCRAHLAHFGRPPV